MKRITDIQTLRNADWEAVEREVVGKINLLRELVNTLKPTEINDKIADELIFPALALLGKFCSCVTVEDAKP